MKNMRILFQSNGLGENRAKHRLHPAATSGNILLAIVTLLIPAPHRAHSPHRLFLPGTYHPWRGLIADARLAVHPFVEPRAAKAPAIAQFEGGNERIGRVFVKRIGADAQVIRSLPDIHYFP